MAFISLRVPLAFFRLAALKGVVQFIGYSILDPIQMNRFVWFV